MLKQARLSSHQFLKADRVKFKMHHQGHSILQTFRK